MFVDLAFYTCGASLTHLYTNNTGTIRYDLSNSNASLQAKTGTEYARNFNKSRYANFHESLVFIVL